MSLEDLLVGVLRVQGPRHDHTRIRPGRCAVGFIHQSGSHVAVRSLARLRVGHIVHPFREKGGNIGVKAGGANKNLGIAEPAEPFVALWAIGWD